MQNATRPKLKAHRVEPGSALSILNPKLAKLLDKALAAMRSGDLVLALKHFGECAEIDPTNKAVLYFGSDAAQRGYFRLRYADPLPTNAKVDEWRHAALTLTMACHWADEQDPVAMHNVGRFLHDDGQDAEAVEWYQKALKINRAQVESWGNLGTCLYTLGDVQGAELCWSKAVAFDATNASGLLSQGYIWLRRGDYLRGWKALNARWEDQTFQASYGRPDLGGKMWTGQPLSKKDTLYIHGEQGLGDHVQFARYVPELIARGYKIAGLETRGPLKRWMEACLPDVLVFDRDKDPAPSFTYHVPMMSLPGLLGMEDVPPALTPMSWRQPLPVVYESRVGLVWKGTTGNPIDDQRSLPDEMLGQLADIPGVTWVPLQYDPSGFADLTARAWLGKSVEPTPKFKDVLEMAEQMATLDMVVAVDTLGCHVAGSLGIPTLILHRHNREWRWGQYSETTPWYPSAEMLTQPSPGDWATVLRQVRDRLAGA